MSNIIEAAPVVAPITTCIPKTVIKRNEYGLICNDSISYVYDENGFIDWRKMIPSTYLVANRQLFTSKGKQVPSSLVGLDDKELLILLAGIKHLAQVRGFSKVKYTINSPSSDCVIAQCSITWIPNYETEGREITFSAIGDANTSNTNSFGKMYLGPIAENRAFVRSVRNFLRISIVGQDEVNEPVTGGASNPNTKMVTSALSEVMNQFGISFEQIQKKLIEEKYLDEHGKGADTYTCVDNIPVDKQFELIARIKKKAKQNES